MDEAHGVQRLVLVHGREAARAIVPDRQQSLVDIAAAVLADEAQRIGFTFAGFCMTSLPHKRLLDEEPWVKKGYACTLLIEPGRLPQRNGTMRLYGVPYGARARMILLYLQGQAIRTGSREVELGRSMRAWLERMGISIGGETMRAMRDQCARISACSMKFAWEQDGGADGWKRGAIVEGGLSFGDLSGQGHLWEDRVLLDQAFFDALRRHPVPLREAAIRELRDRSMSLDLYVWLAYRLHSLSECQPISWPALYGQFGTGYSEMRHFRPRFTEALVAALTAYPEARVDLGEGGIVLHPSHPPVAAAALARA